MKNMKRVLAILLVLVMSFSLFTSCESASSIIKKADNALLNTPYEMKVSTKFSSTNQNLNQVLSSVNMSIPVTINGNDMMMKMNIPDSDGNTIASSRIILIEDILYYTISADGQSAKYKCTITAEQSDELMKESSATLPVTPKDFITYTLTEEDGKKIIQCTSISEAGLKNINGMFSDMLDDSDIDTQIEDISMTATIQDDKYKKISLVYKCKFEIEGQSFSITMTMNCDFNYDKVSEITAPSDANAYTSVNFDTILNGK